MSASNTDTPFPNPDDNTHSEDLEAMSVKDKLGESGSVLKYGAQAAAQKANEIATRAGHSAKQKIVRTEADAQALLADEIPPGDSKLLLKVGVAAAASTAAVLAAVWLWRHSAKSQEDRED